MDKEPKIRSHDRLLILNSEIYDTLTATQQTAKQAVPILWFPAGWSTSLPFGYT